MKLAPSILMALGLAASAPGLPADEPDSPPSAQAAATERRAVDLAICLDTSGSMSGLINAAKQKLWAIVNDLALAKPTPVLRVSLLTFGTPAYGEETGFVKLRATLTEDLDKVSEELFALTTDGGDEYVGRVLITALKELPWSSSKDSLKIIIVAGNESADQDQVVSFRDACKGAITNDIVVNSIYCGSATDDEAPLWREVALLADGRFATIDQDNGIAVIETPFDDQLAAMSGEVNDTYLPYGQTGADGASNQIRQDLNASSMNPAAAASRAQTKAGKLYFCAWDLVDAVKQGQVELDQVKDE
ncbi:MAG: vWA domain-containing protein, partial [Planctomycetota bacterium]